MIGDMWNINNSAASSDPYLFQTKSRIVNMISGSKFLQANCGEMVDVKNCYHLIFFLLKTATLAVRSFRSKYLLAFFQVISAFKNPEFLNSVFPMLYEICKKDSAKNFSPSPVISSNAGTGELSPCCSFLSF